MDDELTKDIWERIIVPAKKVLSEGNITIANITGFEVIGGGVRIPKIQSILTEFLGREPDRHLNGDESATFGAMFYAAQLSTTMKVPPYKVRDTNIREVRADILFPENSSEQASLNVIGDNSTETNEEEEETEKTATEELNDASNKTLTLFKKGNKFGGLKTLKFKPVNDQFTVKISYVEGEKEEGIASYLISNISQYESYNWTKTPKVHVAFRLTTSGLVELEKAEVVFQVVVYPKIEEEEKEEENETIGTGTNSTSTTVEGTVEGKEEENNKEETEEERKEKAKEKKEKERKEKKNKKKKAKEREKALEPKKYAMKLQLNVEKTKLGIPSMSKEEIMNGKKIILGLNKKDLRKKETSDAKNELETFIYATKDQIYDSQEFKEVSTEEERTKLLEELEKTGNWLYDEGEDVELEEYRSKLKVIKTMAKPINYRMEERRTLPMSAYKLIEIIKETREIISNITKYLEVDEGEVEMLNKSCGEAESWIMEKMKEQSKRKAEEEPIISTAEVVRRAKGIESEGKRLKRSPLKKLSKIIGGMNGTKSGNETESKEEEKVNGSEGEVKDESGGEEDLFKEKQNINL